ncbi:MAG: pirin family protein [Saprospiraceae bacterium]|nr:pirin family protein [Saprospiraceae bacterium]
MTRKSTEAIISPPLHHFVGDGFRVHNFIPGIVPMHRMSPFLMLDHNSKYYFPPSVNPRGVDVHPHKGFETVTIAYKGRISHHDSTGNSDVIEEGGVQWMTAGSGILHKEYHEKEYSAKGGDFQMVQLWVNLPSRFKETSPKYQGFASSEIPFYELENNQGIIEIISGEYEGLQGAATTFSPTHLLNAKIVSGGKASFSFPSSYSTALLIIEGNALINNEEFARTDHFVLFKNDGTDFEIEAKEDAIVLILSGEPILEPIVAHGPFVMNTSAQIEQAILDYKNGKFGSIT